MCLVVPGKLLAATDPGTCTAPVDVCGVVRTVNMGLLSDDPPAPGDWVSIHVGFALSKLDEEEARMALEVLEMMRT